MLFRRSRSPSEVPSGYKHGLVPPRLARQLGPFFCRVDPRYVADRPPRYSLECELIWRTVPLEHWYGKDEELSELQGCLDVVRDQLAKGGGARRELRELERELDERVTMLDIGYSVLYRAHYFFFDWLARRKVLAEHAYQALEEYAEGAGGNLSSYWPEAARQEWTEGALVAADWVLARFEAEKKALGRLPPAQLAFLHSDNPDYRTKPIPPPITRIPPRNPSARIVGDLGAHLADLPPPYTFYRTDDQPSHFDLSPGSPYAKGHSSDSGHGDMRDLIDFEESPSSRARASH